MDQDLAWRDNAACSDVTENVTDLFFPHIADERHLRREAAHVAAEFCDDCTVRHDCLEYALHRELDGIWAGTTPTERRAMRRTARIALIEDPDPIPHATTDTGDAA